MPGRNAYPTGEQTGASFELKVGTWQAEDPDRFRRFGAVTITGSEEYMSELDKVIAECADSAVMYNGRKGS